MAEQIPPFPRSVPAKKAHSASNLQTRAYIHHRNNNHSLQPVSTLDFFNFATIFSFVRVCAIFSMSRGGRGGGRGGRGGGRGGRPNVPWDTGEEPDARPSELFPVRISSISMKEENSFANI